MRRLTSIFSMLAALGLLSGCGGPDEYTPEAGISAADIFAAACQSCHGEAGQGKFGFLLKIAGDSHTAAEIADKVRDGGFIMPSFPNIGDKERQALAEYVRAQ
jgi:mono/diheme cytochrome c family protein